MSFFSQHIAKKQVLLHVLFWATWVLAFVLIQSLEQPANAYFVWLMYYLITLPVFVAHTYLLAYWVIPRYFFTGRYGLFALLVLALLMGFSVLELLVSNEIVFAVFDPSKQFGPGYLNIKNICISGIGNQYVVLVFLAIKVGTLWYNSDRQRENLLLASEYTELELFQYRQQPRLVLSLVEQMEQYGTKFPDRMPDIIIKVSGFLNRFLFEGRESLIPLPLDILMLREYLDIHREALSQRVRIHFEVDAATQNRVVPPLLLLPFLYDALKIVYACNNSFEMAVLVKTDPKYLLFSFSLWSENNFRLEANNNVALTKQRLNQNFRGKYRLIETIDDNFREISVELNL